MRVLDLFSGLGGWIQPFRDRGHECVTSDINPRFRTKITGDILSRDVQERIIGLGPYDLVTASPPCEGFSVMVISRNWDKIGKVLVPKSASSVLGMSILAATIGLIHELEPRWWVIENPRAAMRKMEMMQGFHRKTVTYCQYGERRMKPTDLWGVFPHGFPSKEPCQKMALCHDRAPRGSRTGTQGIKGSADRSKIPYELALELCVQAEEDVRNGCLAGHHESPELDLMAVEHLPLFKEA